MIKRILLLLLCSSVAQAGDWVKQDAVEYHGSTGQTVVLSWNFSPEEPDDFPTANTLTYQVKIGSVERTADVRIINYAIPRNTLSITFSLPKSGHWIVYARTRMWCGTSYEDPEEICTNHTEPDREEGYAYSDWNTSLDPQGSTVDGVERGWLLFAWIAKPGPITSNSILRENR